MPEDRRRSDDSRIDLILEHLKGQDQREKEREERQEKLFEAKLDPINELLAEHHRTLFGNGSEENQGIRVDVDRLKQTEKTRTKYIGALVLAIVASIGQSIWKMINLGSK